MSNEEAEQKPPSPKPPVSRRQFLKGVGVVGATTTLAPGLLPRGEAAPNTPPDDTAAAVQRGTINLTLRVNGQKRVAEIEPRTTLLNALRNHLDPPLTGSKIVCDRGACGACTVLIDNKTAYACMLLAADVAHKNITTIEGLAASDDRLHPVQEAFVEHDALMCGFCTPGFVLSIKSYLDKTARPTPAGVRNACAGNVCRCGTYPKVFEAALAAAQQARPKKES